MKTELVVPSLQLIVNSALVVFLLVYFFMRYRQAIRRPKCKVGKVVRVDLGEVEQPSAPDGTRTIVIRIEGERFVALSALASASGLSLPAYIKRVLEEADPKSRFDVVVHR